MLYYPPTAADDRRHRLPPRHDGRRQGRGPRILCNIIQQNHNTD